MKNSSISTKFLPLIVTFLFLATINKATATCATTASPTFSSGCSAEYYTSITASGTSVSSTIAYSGSSCSGSYFNYFATQGITAPAGTTVNMSINRVYCTYTGYLTVYVDWNNDGIYSPGELAGTMITLGSHVTATTYNFTIPTTGVVTGVNLHMRVFLSELSSGQPCTGNYGEACEYYINVTCTTPTISVSPSPTSFCSGGSGVSLTATGAGTGGTYSWLPSTGLSATTGATVTATPGSTTIYTVTGTTTLGCSATAIDSVIVNPLPLTTVTASGPVTFCAGDSVTLTATAGSGYSYQWYNGASAIAGATSISYTTNANGTYSVLVTSGFGCSATSTSTVVTVNTLPTAVITPAGPTTFCSGGSVVLNATTGAGYTYQWFNGSTLITGAVTAAHTVTTSGTYKVVITNGSGCIDTSIGVIVTVNPLPTTTITLSGSLTFCAGGSVTLTATSGAGYSYQWYRGVTAIAGATTISYTATTTGNYKVTVTSGAGCSATSITYTVTVSALPTASITAAGPTTFCAGSSVVLNAVSGAGYTYQWFNSGTAISGAVSSSYTATTNGNYTIVVTSASGCTDTSTSISVTVNPLPSTIVTASGSLTFCSGDSVILTTIGGLGYSYEWYNGVTAIAGATNNSYSALVSGNYKVTVTNTFGCSATSSITTVTVNTVPTAIITPAGATTFCTGSSVVLNATTGAGYSYVWLNSGTLITGAASAAYTATTTGNYVVVITGTGGCTDTSLATVVTVNPLPTATITASGVTTFCAGNSVTFTTSAGAGYTYQWYNGVTLIIGATNISYTATTNGNYNVIVSNSFGCTATSVSTLVTVIPIPSSVITASGPTTFCSGSSVVLSCTPGAGFTYQWYNTGFAIPGANAPSYTATVPGTYTVRIINIAGCSSTTTTGITVTVNPIPTITVTASGALTFCAGGFVNLTASTASSYQWYNGTTLIAGATNGTYGAVTTGNYNVTETNSFGCSNTSSSTSVVVNPLPNTVISASGSTILCPGGTVTLSVPAVAGTTYQWFFNGAVITGAIANSYIAIASGLYNVSVLSGSGCTATSATTNVTIISSPIIVAVGDTKLCSGYSLLLKVDVGGSTTGLNFQWKLNGVAIIGATNSTYVTSMGGNFTCVVSIPGSCTTTTPVMNVIVYPPLHPLVYWNGHTFYTDNYYVSYQWYNNAISIPGATTNSVVPGINGSYRVKVTDTNGCEAYSSAYLLYNLSVNNTINNSEISIYPNPATNMIHISCPVKYIAVITAIDGKTVISYTDADEINISSLSKGLYIISVYNEDKQLIKVEKLIKE